MAPPNKIFQPTPVGFPALREIRRAVEQETSRKAPWRAAWVSRRVKSDESHSTALNFFLPPCKRFPFEPPTTTDRSS